MSTPAELRFLEGPACSRRTTARPGITGRQCLIVRARMAPPTRWANPVLGTAPEAGVLFPDPRKAGTPPDDVELEDRSPLAGAMRNSRAPSPFPPDCGELLPPQGSSQFAYSPGVDIKFCSTWSRLKLPAFCRGGYSLKVARNCATKPWAGTSRNTRSIRQCG